MSIGVNEAASRLHVPPEHVRRMIRAGRLHAERVSGRYLVDPDSLDSLLRHGRPPHVRSFSPAIAWAAAALADGQTAGWLSPSETSRLRRRLSAAEQPPSLGAWRSRLARRAHRSVTVRAGRRQLPQLVADPATWRTGPTASNLVTDPMSPAEAAELWVADENALASMEERFGLLPSNDGNVTIHLAAVPGTSRLGLDDNAFRLIVSADLLTSSDARCRLAGERLLQSALDDRRWERRAR